MDNLKIKTSWL